MNTTDAILADIVWLFHVLVVLFVIFAPFTFTPSLLVLHIAFSASLLVHWWGNSNVCSLSVIESKLRGLPYTKSFTHRFVGPMYEISSSEWSSVCYAVTISLMLFSMYVLYKSAVWTKLKRCWNKTEHDIRIDSETRSLSAGERATRYFQCVQRVFF